MLANIIDTWRIKLRELFYQHAKLCATHPLVVLSLAFTCINTCSAPALWAFFYSPTSVYRFWEFSDTKVALNVDLDSPSSGNKVRVEQIFIDVSLATKFTRDDFLDPGSLNIPSLQLAERIQKELSELKINSKNLVDKKYNLRDICLESLYKGNCIVYSPLEFWNNDLSNLKTSNFDALSKIVSKWEVNGSFGLPVPAWTVFNGLHLDHKAKNIVGAESLLITYFLRDSSTIDASQLWRDLWSQISDRIGEFCEDIGNIQLNSIIAGQGEVKTNHFKFSSHRQRISTELLVLSLGYLTVILYLFFFLNRFQLVKSKFWLGFAAVFLLNVSLLMSFGLCLFFGYELNFLPWEVVPILIIAVGAENMLRLTNSVVSTSLDLPVKERIGIGVKNCSIGVTAHLFGELSILGAASLFSNPAIREFGLFGSIAVIIDYILQLTFFIAVLAIDIRRLELSDLQDRKLWPISDSDTTKSTIESDESLILATMWESMLEQLEKVKSYSFFKFGLLGLSVIAVGFISEKLRRSTFFSQQEDLHLSESILQSRYQLDTKFWEVINPAQSDLYIEFRPPTKVSLTWSPSYQELANFSIIKSQDYTPPKRTIHKPNIRSMVLLLLTGGLITMYLKFLARGRRRDKAQWESLNPRNTIRIFKGMWADITLLASNGKELVAALSLSGELIVWSYFVDNLVFRFNSGFNSQITALAISANSWLAYGDANGNISLVNLASSFSCADGSVSILSSKSERSIIQISFLPENPNFLVARSKGGHLIICDVTRFQIIYSLDKNLKATFFKTTKSDIIIGLLHEDLKLVSVKERSLKFSSIKLSSFCTSAIAYISSLDLEGGRMRAILIGYNNYDSELFLTSDNTTLCQLAFPSRDNRHQDSLLDISLAAAPDGIYVIKSHVGYTSVSHVTYRDSTQAAPPTSPAVNLKLVSSSTFTSVGCPYNIVLPGALLIGLSRSSLDWNLWGFDLSLNSSLDELKRQEKLEYKLISDPLLVSAESASNGTDDFPDCPSPGSPKKLTINLTSQLNQSTKEYPWVPFGSVVAPMCHINESSGVAVAMSNYIICFDPTTLLSIPAKD